MTQLALWGTIVNTIAVLAGALLGIAIKALLSRAAKRSSAEGELPSPPSRLSNLSQTVQHALGLCVILIGIQGAFGAQNILIVILSMVIGVIVGELLDLDGLVNRLGLLVEKKMKNQGGRVAEGFVSATLLFCVGAMTVTGAIESGMLHQHTTYYAKAMLDMVAAVIFASSLGIGVAFSALGVFAVQGLYTMAAVLAAGAIPAAVTGEMIAVGSLLVIGIGTNLLGLTRLKIMNFLPAMFCPIALCPLFACIPVI